MTAWAEVIGDPIAHSRSPFIHGFWLKALGAEGNYRATQVRSDGLGDFFAERRADPDWRGCNVTAPHKLSVMSFLDRLSEAAEATGAVNCITRDAGALMGTNTDVDGVGAALAETAIQGRKAVLIGAGGAARAALAWLEGAKAGEILCLARDPDKAASALPSANIRPISAEAFDAASVVVNASPLGMAHAGAMPDAVFDGLARAAPDATAFDMVYQPLDTAFLQAARRQGLRTADGLTMLIGQARRAFALFFGAPPPRDRDHELRCLLLG